MNRKGFTLVEVIAVVAVLAVILLVSFPVYNGVIKRNTTKRYDDFMKTLCEAGQYYILHNNDTSLLNNTTTRVQIKDLKINNNSLVRSDLVNPRTKETVDLNAYLVITRNYNGVYTCVLE